MVASLLEQVCRRTSHATDLEEFLAGGGELEQVCRRTSHATDVDAVFDGVSVRAGVQTHISRDTSTMEPRLGFGLEQGCRRTSHATIHTDMSRALDG